MKFLYLNLFLFFSLSLNAQNFESIQYQGQLKDPTGNPEKIMVHVIITDSAKSWVKIYQEMHAVTSTKAGIYDLNLGKGTHKSGIFHEINWGSGKKYLTQNIDRGQGFQNIGSIQLHNIPTPANHAKAKTYVEHLQVDAFVYKAPMHWLGNFMSPPLDPLTNQAYYNKADKRSYVYDGKIWSPLDPCSGANCHTIGKRYCLR